MSLRGRTRARLVTARMGPFGAKQARCEVWRRTGDSIALDKVDSSSSSSSSWGTKDGSVSSSVASGDSGESVRNGTGGGRDLPESRDGGGCGSGVDESLDGEDIFLGGKFVF